MHAKNRKTPQRERTLVRRFLPDALALPAADRAIWS
jgi:hypothetical protein